MGHNVAEYYGLNSMSNWYNDIEEGITGSKVNKPLRKREFVRCVLSVGRIMLICMSNGQFLNNKNSVAINLFSFSWSAVLH